MTTFDYCGFVLNPEIGLVLGKRGQPLKAKPRGYVVIRSRKTGSIPAHRAIWEAANGPIPPGMQINHINGIKHDNRLENLEVVTPSENILHAYATNLASAVGEKNGRAKLTARDVLAIRKSPLSSRVIAKQYGVSSTCILEARSGKSWACIPQENKS